jgi:hypothetical protein
MLFRISRLNTTSESAKHLVNTSDFSVEASQRVLLDVHQSLLHELPYYPHLQNESECCKAY